jgi:ABC-type transport system involved in multi-copper enzyme maturation permease subunit
MYKTKKAAIDLTELAIGIVVLGIVVSIGAVILNKMASSQIVNSGTSVIGNETITPSTAGKSLAGGWVQGVSTVTNASNGVLIAAPNYTVTVNPDTGIATIANVTPSLGPTWNVTYTVYNKSDPRFALPNTAELGLAEYGNWFKILVIVGIAAVILALIFMAFGNKQTQVGGAY